MSDLFAGGKFAWDLMRGLISSYEREREDLFNKHVEPLQQRILLIHADYISGLEQVNKQLNDGTMGLDEIAQYLSSRRRSYLAERDLAKEIAAKLGLTERRPVRVGAWSALVRYCDAISEYLSAPYDFERGSMYANLLRETRKAAEIDFTRVLFQCPDSRQLDRWEKTEGINRWDLLKKGEIPLHGPGPREILASLTVQMLDRDLPERLNKVNAAYAELRVCLI